MLRVWVKTWFKTFEIQARTWFEMPGLQDKTLRILSMTSFKLHKNWFESAFYVVQD
jgi:hypothetical protein